MLAAPLPCCHLPSWVDRASAGISPLHSEPANQWAMPHPHAPQHCTDLSQKEADALNVPQPLPLLGYTRKKREKVRGPATRGGEAHTTNPSHTHNPSWAPGQQVAFSSKFRLSSLYHVTLICCQQNSPSHPANFCAPSPVGHTSASRSM